MSVEELKRSSSSRGFSFIARGCHIDIKPINDGVSLSINDLAAVFDEAKLQAIRCLSLELIGGEP